jgi:hypothetical protein
MTVAKLRPRILSHYGHHDSRCFPTICVKFLGPELGRVEPRYHYNSWLLALPANVRSGCLCMTVAKIRSRTLSHYGHHNSHCFPTICVKFLGPELSRVELLIVIRCKGWLLALLENFRSAWQWQKSGPELCVITATKTVIVFQLFVANFLDQS